MQKKKKKKVPLLVCGTSVGQRQNLSSYKNRNPDFQSPYSDALPQNLIL